ncbi:MAG: MFS transporter [Dehalococcoidia bacterium]|nr:MFS transporter [Dehalococcoidia bacterium]
MTARPFTAARNVRLLYGYMGVANLQPHLALWVVYLLDFRGLTLTEVGIMEGFFWGISLLLELPTGAFSDRFGRCPTAIVASVVEGAGIIAFALAGSFPALLGAYVLWSGGLAFRSGNSDAMLYDTLTSTDRSADYARLRGRLGALDAGALMLGGIFGAAVAAATNLQLPILLGVISSAVSAVIAFGMQEPPRHAVHRSLSYLGTLTGAVGALRRDAALRYIILFDIVVVSAFVADFLLMQPFLIRHDVALALFGLFLIPTRLLGAGASIVAWRVPPLLGGLRPMVGLVLFGVCAGLTLLGLVDSLAAYAGFVISRSRSTSPRPRSVRTSTTARPPTCARRCSPSSRSAWPPSSASPRSSAA